MQAHGQLKTNQIIISKSKDIGRLYNKNKFGKTINGNKIALNLLEAAFLLNERKIIIFQYKKKVEFKKIFDRAGKIIPRFEIKYNVFADIRKRGHHVHLLPENSEYDFYISNNEKEIYINVFSERDKFKIEKLLELTKENNEKKNQWLAIVDDESDITYYEISDVALKGKIKQQKYKKTSGILSGDRIVIHDEKISNELFSKEFYGKPFGTGIQLSLIEGLYLAEKQVLKIKNVRTNKILSPNGFNIYIRRMQPDINIRYKVYFDLKKHGLIVKTGFKFGVDFRVYTKDPNETHAEYLVHILKEKIETNWSYISRTVRLAHSVNKEIILCRVFKKNLDYIKLGRLRP